MPILRIMYQSARETFDIFDIPERSKTVLMICFATVFWRLIALFLIVLAIPYVLEMLCRVGLFVKRAFVPRRQPPAPMAVAPAKPQVDVCHLPAVRCANAQGQITQPTSATRLDVDTLSDEILATATVRGPFEGVDPESDASWIGMSESLGINFHALPVVAGAIAHVFRKFGQLTQERTLP